MINITPRQAGQAGVNLAILAIGLIALLVFLRSESADAAPTTPIANVGIDMNTSGNSARSQVGVTTTRDTCNRVDNGQTLSIDIYEDQVASDRGASGFQLILNYDASKVRVTAVDYNELLSQASGSLVIPFGDTTSSDGTAGLSALDLGKGIEPSGASEVGPGIWLALCFRGRQAPE